MKITTIGIDLAKSVFQLHGVDADGAVVLRKKLRRGAVLDFLGELEPCLIGMEACATSHYWAREIAALGHDVRLIPPAYVKPYVKRQKNDAADAEAICEAVTRPNMRFVPVKTEEQQSVLVLHRSRDLLMRQRTMMLNAIRAHLAEFGIIAAQGPRKVGRACQPSFGARCPRRPRRSPGPRFWHWRLNSKASPTAIRDDRTPTSGLASARTPASQRLETIPGVGIITATALAASVPDPSVFKSGPTVRGLPRPGAATELIRRQGSPRAHLEDGQRLSAAAAGRRRDLGDPTGRNHRHPNRGLGTVAPGAQADPARHRCHRQQDRAHRLGHAGATRRLPSLRNGLNLPEQRQPSAAAPNARAEVSDDDQTGPQPGHPEVLSGLPSSLV